MGNDGGTIARRQDILSLHSYGKQGKEANQIADDNENSILTTCALSSLPLFNPESPQIVGDYKGKLYLKEQALEYILKQKTAGSESSDKTTTTSRFSHIRSLNDIVDVHINWKVTPENTSPSIECPVSKELKNNKTVYAFLRPCGCVLSYKFLEGIMKYLEEQDPKSDVSLKERDCPNCGKGFCFKYDVVIMNPLDIDKYNEFNENSLSYLQNNLNLTHSKRPKKSKKKRRELRLDIYNSAPREKKRSTDVSSSTNSSERKRTSDVNNSTNSSKKVKT